MRDEGGGKREEEGEWTEKGQRVAGQLGQGVLGQAGQGVARSAPVGRGMAGQAEREEQRWRVDNPRRRFQQQQRQQQQHAGAFPLQGIASARPNAADSDGSAAAAAAAAGLWGLRWVEVGEPLPRWRSAEVSYAVRIPLSVLSH